MRKFERIWQSVLRGEAFLMRFAILLGLSLLLVQGALYTDTTRLYFSQVDYLEGQSITFDEIPTAYNNFTAVENVVNTREILRKGQTIHIRMLKPLYSNEVIVTVNGQTVGNFHAGYTEFIVYSGDYVEIDATKLQEDAQYIINTSGSEELKNLHGLVLESKHNIITIGKIKFTPTN